MKYTLILFLFILHIGVYGSHISSYSFNYQNIGGNTYQICLKKVRVCPPANLPNFVNLSITSSCGSGTATATLYPNENSEIFTQVCDTNIPNNSCITLVNNPNLIAYEVIEYCGTFTLSSPCNSWTIFATGTVRGSSNNILGTPNMMIKASINNAHPSFQNNSSPRFNAPSDLRFIVGQKANFNPMISDFENDSLVYQLITPAASSVANASYQINHSVTHPFGINSPITFDSTTGQLSFTPLLTGNYVIAYRVCEYRNGILLGCVDFDFMFVIINQNNVQPFMQSGISNFQGNATLVDSVTIDMCVGQNFSFQLTFLDSLGLGQTVGDSISISSNIATILPGAVITASNGNPAVLNVSWTAVQHAVGQRQFNVQLKDNACPYYGTNIYSFVVRVSTGAWAGGDKSICGANDTAFIQAVGGTQFTWSVVSGDPIIPNVNFSDTTGTNGVNVWAKPTQTTTYQLQSNIGNMCTNSSTFTVHVFNINTINDTAICISDSMQLDIQNPSPCLNGVEQFTWTPSTGLSNPTIRNPMLKPVAGQGTTTYHLSYNDGCGCQTSDSITVHISSVGIASTQAQKISCGNPDGQITINAIGNSPPFSYSINNGQSFSASNIFTNLNSGAYTVRVQDSMGCVSNSTIVGVTDPNSPFFQSAQITPVACFGQLNGQIAVSALGGTPPLEFSINNGLSYQTSGTFSPLTAGTYHIQIRDANGCIRVDSFQVSQPPLLFSSPSFLDANCSNSSDGFAFCNPSGGTQPYSFVWNTGDSTPSLDSIPPGAYSFTVYDSNNCTTSASIQIGFAHVSPNISLNDSVPMCSDRSITLDAGNAGSQFIWSNGDTNQITTINMPGIYTVTVIDQNNCESTKTVVVYAEPCTGLQSFGSPRKLKIYPNPNNGRFVIESEEEAELRIITTNGQLISQLDIQSGLNLIHDLPTLSNGIYFVIGTTSNGEWISQRIIVQ
jgi:hypothetical protein